MGFRTLLKALGAVAACFSGYVDATAAGVDAAATSQTPFKYRSYGKMVAYLQELSAKYPEVIRLSVAQETYKLPYPEKLMCIENDETKEPVHCKHFVVHLTNHSTLPDATRPEVFISGALHGNERVGPITAVELITIMAEYATSYANGNVTDDALNTKRWLYELVNTRSIYLTPMTNAYGYAHETREELGIDPNRDYNYMRKPEECMVTMTSRVVNEIWREHIFQLAITFHGGMRAVSYEWGSPDHYLKNNGQRSEKSPDHLAQFQLANLLSTYAGAFPDGNLYPTGTMNDIVYGVTGGMEDWGYAASWENKFIDAYDDQPFKPCSPKTFGGYPTEKTIYNNITHRAFNMLVETSNNKHPDESTLGNFEDLYTTELDYFRPVAGFQAGHVTQNVRLALMMIEMVQPYIRWVDAHPIQATTASSAANFYPASLYVSGNDELTKMGCGGFALANSEVASCNSTDCRVQQVNGSAVKIQLAWEVLGALTVDKTNGVYDKDLHVRAVAVVDQDWASQGSGDDAPSPRIPPQSHLVNARTNPDWDAEWMGHRVKASIVPETDAPATSESDSDETPSADFDDFSQLDDEDEFDGELSDEEQDENKEPAATESTKDLAFTPSSINANSKTQTDLSATQQEKEPSSLQGFGFIVLGSGGLVIVATLAFLYKRVFRSKRQQYMNINNQRLPTTV
uniref:Peptidase M14 domain-containing protein n=1 Tax=Globisporangium ultimum (strain ATCC 200006 / CBS 805.95 / DAOM BR144) TaxID=431595 RepID=K3WED6_GLOUD